MSQPQNQDQDSRVLSRQGARYLSNEELYDVNGAAHTNNCSFIPSTGKFDGDAC